MEPGQVKQEENLGEAGNRALRRPLFWLFLTAFLILLVIFFRSSSRWPARIKEVRSSLKKRYILKIQISRVSDGKNILSNFDYFPVTAGFTKKADILLPNRERLQCKIDLKEDEACFSSDKMILVNGVARREKRLKLGDCILFDGYRLFFKGLSISEPPLPERPFPQFIWQIPVLILFLTLSFLFLPAGRKAMTRTAGTVGQEQYPLPVLSLSDPLVIEPGLKPEFFKADIMFVHAHPDDESLDFGALMALASSSGRRTVTVLFTDGEAGLDRYPHRQVGGDYPNHRLKGRPLADVRVEEARKALAVLGSRKSM
ncbi:1D-myo-inositol 2-acetamido-2-deoxy-alpha-D-glucopyranoside deacetylase [subsurface metagenome]